MKLSFIIRLFRKHYVVDYMDSCVMYIGTYKECVRAIDVLPGGIYGILTKNQLSDDELKTI